MNSLDLQCPSSGTAVQTCCCENVWEICKCFGNVVRVDKKMKELWIRYR